MVRAVIAFMWLPVLIYAFVARMLSEVWSGLWFAWNDVRIENSELIDRWRRNSFNPEDWS